MFMNKMAYPVIGWLLIWTFLTAGCIGAGHQKTPETVYYTLEYESPLLPGQPAIDPILKIEAFQCAPEYDFTQIIYRDDRFRRNGYYYHRWRARPGDLVPYFLTRDFTRAEAFKAVYAGTGNQTATHRLEGRIEEFYEKDAPEGWSAVVSVAVTLLAENEPDASRRVLFQKIYRISEPCAGKNPEAVVQAVSQAMSGLSTAVFKDVYNALAGPAGAGSGK
jgi:cholesterol transport system auxiliary component